MNWIRTIVPLALLGFIGCGSEEDRINIVPVSGKVTKNGRPLAGATITFMPDVSNKDSTPGVAATGPDGDFNLMWRNRSGVAPGKYRVAIVPAFTPTGPVNPAFANDPYMEQVSLEAAAANTGPGRGKKKVAAEKNEFEAKVSENGEVLNFDVKSSPER